MECARSTNACKVQVCLGRVAAGQRWAEMFVFVCFVFRASIVVMHMPCMLYVLRISAQKKLDMD